MTPEPGVSFSPSQPPSQLRRCVVGLERGLKCLPVVPNTEYCDRHHPDRAVQRTERASQAARASHATWRPDPEIETWADNITWDTEEEVHRFLHETAVFVAKKAITPAQGQVMARLAEERLKGFQKAPAQAPSYQVVVGDYSRPTPEASETP